MASVGSLTSSTSSSIRGYGGLASGLDRDELIEGMTIGTRTKINQQEQKKQKIEWMQEAVRTISDKMISFHGKYTETLTSSSNLFSSVLWGRNKITTSGANSKYVAVSGTASGADAMTIMAVKQRAQNATWSSPGVSDTNSTYKLSSGEIKATDSDTYAALNGKTIEFSYGTGDRQETYTITLSGLEDGMSEAEMGKAVAKQIEDSFNNYKINDNGKLSDRVALTVSYTDKKFTFNATNKEDDPSTGKKDTPLKITGGTALTNLGMEGTDVSKSITETPGLTTASDAKLTNTFGEMVTGKTLTFSYNGNSQSVTIAKGATLAEVKESLQKELDTKFGKDRILVDDAGGKLTFKTVTPKDTTQEDKSSILKIVDGDDDALKALNLSRGSSNRTNLDANWRTLLGTGNDFKAGTVETLKDADGNDIKDEAGNPVTKQWYDFQLNGKTISIREDASVRDLINTINKSDANVTVSYQEASDKFTFTSKEDGESGVIHFKGNEEGSVNALNDIFKLGISGVDDEGKRGEDAIIRVKYAGSDEEVELRRGTNSFTVDGLTFTLKGEFGFKKDADGKVTDERDTDVDPVEITAEVDVDRVLSTIKSFVEDYNAIVDMVNTELTTKHDRDYDPLSSEQKSELSDSEVEKWEAKAKAGLLYGDSDLRNLSMDLRVVVSGGNLIALQNVGISVSSNYADNGKLSIDETKLRAALETNPESVEKLFTSTNGVDANGNETFNGLATNLKNVMNKYVKTTGPMEDKGVLIRKAGSKSAALSLTQNYYYDQLTGINKLLDTLNDRLKTEQDRYISQFSSLETLINNMNSQSSYLSSMF